MKWKLRSEKKVCRDKGLGNAQIRNFPETQNDSEERDDEGREWGIILVSGIYL